MNTGITSNKFSLLGHTTHRGGIKIVRKPGGSLIVASDILVIVSGDNELTVNKSDITKISAYSYAVSIDSTNIDISVATRQASMIITALDEMGYEVTQSRNTKAYVVFAVITILIVLFLYNILSGLIIPN